MNSIIKGLKQPFNLIDTMHRRFRWLEVLYPAGLAIFFFASLTYILYSGNQRDKLSANAEGLLIRKSLKMALSPVVNQNATVIISVDERDYKQLMPAPGRRLFDVHIQEYAKLIEKVSAAKPEVIFFSWLPGAHQTDVKYLQPIVNTLRKIKNTTKIFLPYSLYEIQFLPPELMDSVRVLEGDDCRYDVQSYCTYNPAWKNWGVQFIADRYWGTPDNPIRKYHVSTNLPHFRENYLLNLADKSSLRELSFSEVLQNDFALSSLQGKAIFIGNNIVQPQSANGDNELLRRTYLAQDDLQRTFEEASTPMHTFYALLAQMFMDKKTIAVPTKTFTTTLTMILCLCLSILLWKFSTTVALTAFLIYTITSPLLNSFMIKYFQVYIPIFDTLYFGFNTFLFSAFGRLSFQVFQKARLEEKQKATTLSTDLKSNFLSLMSHNLNTPVAKMQGVLDIIMNQQEERVFLADMQKASGLVAKLQLGIRATLVLTALEEKSVNNTAITLRAFETEFEDLVGSLLKRLSIQYSIRFDDKFGEDSLHVPFKMDSRSLNYALACALSLLTDDDEKTQGTPQAKLRVKITGQLQELLDNKCLTFLIDATPTHSSSLVLELLNAPSETQPRSQSEWLSLGFFEDVKINLLKVFCRVYSGKIRVITSEAIGTQIKIQLFVS